MRFHASRPLAPLPWFTRWCALLLLSIPLAAFEWVNVEHEIIMQPGDPAVEARGSWETRTAADQYGSDHRAAVNTPGGDNRMIFHPTPS